MHRFLTGARLTFLLVCSSGVAAAAQQPELRVDALGPSPYEVSAGAGVVFPFGYYARGSADVSYGARRRSGQLDGSGRADLLMRFLFDPFGEERWGLSIGGGLSIRRITYLAIVAELEGPASHGVRPAFQVGVSGGWRAGFLLRRATPDHR